MQSTWGMMLRHESLPDHTSRESEVLEVLPHPARLLPRRDGGSGEGAQVISLGGGRPLRQDVLFDGPEGEDSIYTAFVTYRTDTCECTDHDVLSKYRMISGKR